MLPRWYVSEVWVIVALVAMITSICLLAVFETTKVKLNIVVKWIVRIVFIIAIIAVMFRSVQQYVVFSWFYF